MAVQLSVQVRGAALVAKRFEDFTGEVKKIGEGRLWGRLQAAKKRVTKYPPRYAGTPAHHWASEKQRRWFFWQLRSNANFNYPYQRSGRYADSWRVEKIQDGYRLRSTHPAAKWIAGSATNPALQYHLHQTRWTPLRVAVEEALDELPREIQDNVVLAARRKGF
jgi:hypothetical protein